MGQVAVCLIHSEHFFQWGAMRKFRAWCSALIVAACAVVGTQIPKISQDYQHQYEARCSELGEQVQDLESRAHKLGQLPAEYIDRHFSQSSDPEVQHQGMILESNLIRWRGMRAQIEKARARSEWRRPLFWFYQKSARSEPLSSYEFELGFSLATLIWALGGAAAGWLTLTLVGALIQKGVRSIGNLSRSIWRRVQQVFAPPHHERAPLPSAEDEDGNPGARP